MTQLLTDNEISTVVQNIDCGEVRPFDIEFARAIEAAVLAKLLEGKPAHLSEVYEQLFSNHAQIPEGWRCPVCNTDLKHEHAYNCMAARSGK